jgi:hypothetical protein
MQFYIQSAVVKKGVRVKDYAFSRIDVGSVATAHNAAIFSASVLPLSTAYYVREAFGFKSDVEKGFREAAIFVRCIYHLS